MPDLIEIRASSLSGYTDCGRRTAANIFRDAIEAAGYHLRQTPQNIGAIIGTAMHEGAAYSLTRKKDHGEMGCENEANQAAIANLEENMQEEFIFDPATISKDDAVKQTKSMLKALRDHIIPLVVPTMIEERLKARIGNIVLSGQTDAGEADGIIDWKSGRVKRYHINQIGAYGLLARSHGKGASKGTEYFTQRVKPDKEQPLPVKSEYDMPIAENSALSITKRIGRDFEEFQKTGSRFAFMANPSSMLCSDKYCRAYGTDFCREHKKKDN